MKFFFILSAGLLRAVLGGGHRLRAGPVHGGRLSPPLPARLVSARGRASRSKNDDDDDK